MAEYKPQQLDKKWQQHWTSSNAFEVEPDPTRGRMHVKRRYGRLGPARLQSREEFPCRESVIGADFHAHVTRTGVLVRNLGVPVRQDLCVR